VVHGPLLDRAPLIHPFIQKGYELMRYNLRTITWRFTETPENAPLELRAKRLAIKGAKDLGVFKFLFDGQVKERMAVVWLDADNRIMGFEVVTEGLLNSSLLHPREVFRGAIVATAASIILMHNHPSGNLEPSKEDVSVTSQVVEAGKIIGIPVHDHIIFAGDGYTSLAERGDM
jgi:DNA repair protein RadC